MDRLVCFLRCAEILGESNFGVWDSKSVCMLLLWSKTLEFGIKMLVLVSSNLFILKGVNRYLIVS